MWVSSVMHHTQWCKGKAGHGLLEHEKKGQFGSDGMRHVEPCL